MRTVCVLLAALAAVLCVEVAQARVLLPTPRPFIVVSNTAETCLARAIYGEARNLRRLSWFMIANSVRRRAELNRSDFGGSDICKVVYQKIVVGNVVRRQYSSITDNDAWIAGDRTAWFASLEVSREVLGGFRPKWPWSEAIYYLDPNGSDKRGRCWFKSRVEVGWLQNHLYYRDPASPEEARALLGQLPPECRAKTKTVHR